MRRILAISFLLVGLVGLATAQFGGNPVAARSLTGVVADRDDRPVADALVSLKNTRTLAVGTYITGANGVYHFNNLSSEVDYEVHAESKGRRSQIKTLSSFDSRKQAHINLRLEK